MLDNTCHFCDQEGKFCFGCQYHICESCDWDPELATEKHPVDAHQEVPI